MTINPGYNWHVQRYTGAALGPPQWTATQVLFLDRLTRLVRKVHLHGRYLVATDRRMQFLNRAILSTFCDCRELGVEAEARVILAELRRDIVLSLAPPVD